MDCEQEAAAWRREAVTQATTMSLRAAADRIANEQIAPLSDQVRWRWKALFGDDGLQLRADGTIVRLVGDRELPWEQLSGGERIWVRLVAGLLVLQASTKLPFAWIDEPLEHLGPRARRVVAADLADAPSRGGPRQLAQWFGGVSRVFEMRQTSVLISQSELSIGHGPRSKPLSDTHSTAFGRP